MCAHSASRALHVPQRRRGRRRQRSMSCVHRPQVPVSHVTADAAYTQPRVLGQRTLGHLRKVAFLATVGELPQLYIVETANTGYHRHRAPLPRPRSFLTHATYPALDARDSQAMLERL